MIADDISRNVPQHIYAQIPAFFAHVVTCLACEYCISQMQKQHRCVIIVGMNFYIFAVYSVYCVTEMQAVE